MVPADSQHISRVRCYSGTRPKPLPVFSRTGLSPTTATLSRSLPLTLIQRLRRPGRVHTVQPHNTHIATPAGLTRPRFSPIRFRSPLLTESRLFSLPVGTEMFHFPTFPPTPYFIQMLVVPHDGYWVSPFGHPRITAWLTTPRGLSRPPTSFIGS